MIRRIFKENDEVVLCIGSAQPIPEGHPDYCKNPYPTEIRVRRLQAFLQNDHFAKPWRIAAVTDIQPESAWPRHLKKNCGLDDNSINTIYFADPISEEYRQEMEDAGFRIKLIRRIKFLYQTQKKVIHNISSATEIRALEQIEE